MAAYLRHSLKLLPQRPVFVRLVSSMTGDYTDLTQEKDYFILVMKHSPANVLTTEFMLEMKKRIQAVENSESHGLIIASAAKNIFSSGLDLNELVESGKSLESLKQYYSLFQDLWFLMYKSRLVTIAAMNGHTIAGGCGLALACDYRVLAEGTYGFGIPTSRLGITMPHYLLDSIQKATSWHRGTATALQARIFNPEEALSIGLVDQVVPINNVLGAAKEQMSSFLRTNHRARVISKMDTRYDLISRFEDLKQKDMSKLSAALKNPETMGILVKIIESMKRNKKT